MCLKRLANFSGKILGEILRFSWRVASKLGFWLGLLLLILIGAMLALIGNVVVLFLGFILNLCILFLKFFAKFTEKLMITTKWASGKVAEYTESFYDGVTNVFQKEGEHLEQEINRIFQTQNS